MVRRRAGADQRLELRDTREYDLAKRPNTFRILVLGDSVTFGHGSVSEHTYPFLLEQRLKAWRPDVDWQVWNRACPATTPARNWPICWKSGRAFNPDLVVVGFFENDLIDNRPRRVARLDVESAGGQPVVPAAPRVFARAVQEGVSDGRWRLSGSDEYRRRLEHLGTEEALIANVEDASALPQQALTPFERLTDAQVRDVNCVYGMKPNPALIRRSSTPADFQPGSPRSADFSS